MKKTLLLFFAITASLNLFAQNVNDNLVDDVKVAELPQVTAPGDTTTVVKPVEAVQVERKSEKAVKVYENGQLYILRNGKKYNLLGVEVE